MAHLVLDIETNAIHMPSSLWCVVTQDIDTGEVKSYVGQDIRRLRDDINDSDTLVGHNIIDYDMRHLSRLADFIHPPHMVNDTLILSRLYHYNIRGGHSLEAWGKRLGQHKGDFTDFDSYSPEMLAYCKRDVSLNVKLYQYLMRKLGQIPLDKEEFLHEKFRLPNKKKNLQWANAIQLEHQMAWVCQEMTTNGFPFDAPGAADVLLIVDKEKDEVDVKLQAVFPPITQLIREVTPRATKSGALHSGDFRWLPEDIPDLTPYGEGHTFSRFSWVSFNPQSPKQVIDRLRKWGWAPFEKTKGHVALDREFLSFRMKHKFATPEMLEKKAYFETYGWKISEDNLSTISPDAPAECALLRRRLLLGSRSSTLKSWLEAYNPDDKCVHGRFSGLGAWSHRMSHSAPNMANIPRVDAPFGSDMRKLWSSPPFTALIGCDASGIQLRILAHLLDNPTFTHHVCEGKEDDLSDIHNVNARLLDVDRVKAKTWIYAWLLGAGAAKMGQILGCDARTAQQKADAFEEAWDGVYELKQHQVRADGDQGYFKGMDGRLVVVPSTHHVLAGYLQNGESIIMKKATIRWKKALDDRAIPYTLHNFVHDEWQTSTDFHWADDIGQEQCKALREVGLELNLKCPLDGNYKIGKTWFDTH